MPDRNTRKTQPGFFFLSRDTNPLFQVTPGIDARTALENAQVILDAAISAIRPVACDIEPIEQGGIWSGVYGLEQVAALLEQAANNLGAADQGEAAAGNGATA